MTARKVLHVVESLHRGAVEAWLLRMLAHGRRHGAPLDWTFYCTEPGVGALDEQARALGARIVSSPVGLDRKVDFARALRNEVCAGGYDILHCHHDLLSGVYLGAVTGLSLRRRLVHVHNADEGVPTPSTFKQYLYRPLLRRTCLTLADYIVGISDHTLDTFLAGRRRRPTRDVVHYYGVDASGFLMPPPSRTALRRELRLPEDALILLFGGRMVPEKNPTHAVKVLCELRRLEPRSVAVFVGSGSEESAVVDEATSLGLSDHVRLMGWRDDLSQIMRACDWFILPRPEHPKEGFGLAVVEAQLAGLRLLLSRGVPCDPLLPTASVRRLSLAVPPSEWAAAAIELQAAPPPLSASALEALAASPMDMDRALADLMALHA